MLPPAAAPPQPLGGCPPEAVAPLCLRPSDPHIFTLSASADLKSSGAPVFSLRLHAVPDPDPPDWIRFSPARPDRTSIPSDRSSGPPPPSFAQSRPGFGVLGARGNFPSRGAVSAQIRMSKSDRSISSLHHPPGSVSAAQFRSKSRSSRCPAPPIISICPDPINHPPELTKHPGTDFSLERKWKDLGVRFSKTGLLWVDVGFKVQYRDLCARLAITSLPKVGIGSKALGQVGDNMVEDAKVEEKEKEQVGEGAHLLE